MKIPTSILAILTPIAGLHASPTGANLDFEDGLNGWTHSGVAIESTDVHEGSQALDLQAGWIEQTLTGLTPGVPHTLQLAYLDATPLEWVLGHARILLDGVTLTELHNKQDHEFLDGIGFEFTPGASQVDLRIEAIPGDTESFIIDDIRVTVGPRPAPPAESWANLTPIADARGGRRLVNGSFEADVGLPANDPYNSGPDWADHLSRFSLPGWLVTRENVDLVYSWHSNAPDGQIALDVSGHGPGGIAQTITGLTPGAVYTCSFYYARHGSWGSDDMTGQALANGVVVEELVRTSAQDWNSPYEIKSIPMLADPSGSLTIEIRSTTTDLGGNILYDDIRLTEGGDAFLAWSRHHGVDPDPDANPDTDPYPHEFEFLLDQDPLNPDPAIVPTVSNGQHILEVPLHGAALAQGYQLDLQASTDLSGWASASTFGVTIQSDTSSATSSGVRRYLLPSGLDAFFVQLVLTRP